MVHRCWSVDEIVRAIAANLVTDEAKASAVALASCSKSLEQPTLEEVWRCLPNLAPLVQCFPPEIWKLIKKKKLASTKNGVYIISNRIPIVFQKSPTPSGMDSISKAVRVEGSIPSISKAGRVEGSTSVCTSSSRDLLELERSSVTSTLLSWSSPPSQSQVTGLA
jgi:hypothetical protein